MAKRPVLIVNDEAAIRKMFQEVLTLEGYPVETATQGQEALDILAAHPGPRVIVLDTLMHVMSGDGVLKALQEGPHRRRYRVILTSADFNLPYWRSLEPDAILPLPCSMDQLIDAIETVTKSWPEADA